MVYRNLTNVSFPSYGWFAPASGIGSRRPPKKSCSSAAAAPAATTTSRTSAAPILVMTPPLLPALRLADLPGLQGQFGDDLLELGRVLLRVHAVLHQPERLHPAFQRAAFLVERPQLRIRGQRIALPGGAEREQRRDSPFLAVGRRLRGSFFVPAVVEQGVLGQQDALALVGGRDLTPREVEGLEHADLVILVRVGVVRRQRVHEVAAKDGRERLP